MSIAVEVVSSGDMVRSYSSLDLLLAFNSVSASDLREDFKCTSYVQEKL